MAREASSDRAGGIGQREPAAEDRLTVLAERRRAAVGNRFWRRLRRERKALLGLVFVGLLALVAAIGPVIAPYDPLADDYDLFASPSWSHPMGTDSFGRDLLSRVIVGTRVSFTVGLLAALSAMAVGVLLGLVAGYYGGWLDSLIMRMVDLLWAFPVIVLAVAMVAVFGAGFRNVVVAIAVAYLDDFARIVRSQVLSLREEDYTTAARSIGATDRRIMFGHILPNMAAPIIVQTTFAVGLGILAEAALTFIGLGVNPSTPTWGMALNEGRDFVRQAWWISVFPGLAIVLTVLALNLFGDGLRDALDVRSVGDAE
ncbi:MAG: peptide/nickel transport system permease protein [Thermomicrobiales bacterium]|jgi:peptide/nickel transport system permease protein|nr:peptide/nickel transport system permease protein [Thermomicrobiales bacterium]